MLRPFTAFTFAGLTLAPVVTASGAKADFEKEIRPLLTEYCLKCHSTEKQKGDLDLERFGSFEAVKSDPKVWESVAEQLELGEMPPKDKPQLEAGQKIALNNWVHDSLAEMALAHAGDPGPVVLRRLSNAEYTYSIRDLTGIESLNPAREFPVDGAAGEGFTNAGAALVMSPSLLTKYFDAAKDIASHAMLLPDGIRFSPHTTGRDWTDDTLAAIRAFYARFSDNGGGTKVDLQGVKFDTNSGGLLPLEKYLATTLVEREALTSGSKSISAVASEHGLNAKYLGTFWSTLTSTVPSPVLDPIRIQWRSAKREDAPAIAKTIVSWQKALWRFATVGQIGRLNGPTAWQLPVTPLETSREIRFKLPASNDGDDVTLYLAASDAGDGNQGDFAVWENARLVAPGRPDLSLRDVRTAVDAVMTYREKVYSTVSAALAAVDTIAASPDANSISQIAQERGLDPVVLKAWVHCLGFDSHGSPIGSLLNEKTGPGPKNYESVSGWKTADPVSIAANSSDELAHIPGNLKPHGIAVHPGEKRNVVVGWKSPEVARLRVQGTVQHAHPECGNGVTWAVELRRGQSRLRLASGVAQGHAPVNFGPIENVPVSSGDVITVVIGPRDGNQSCDLTAVDLKLSDGTREWNLAPEVSPNILAGNPHADGFGNLDTWHFFFEPTNGGGELAIPEKSLLTQWLLAPTTEEKQRIAGQVQELLASRGKNVAKDSPDAALYRELSSLTGPLFSAVRNDLLQSTQSAAPTNTASLYGLDPALFGRHPSGAAMADRNLCVQAPSVLELRLPAELVIGCELVATTTLDPSTGVEGTVQMQVRTTRPEGINKPGSLTADLPVVVGKGSTARKRFETACDEFRQVFPAALCYTSIVPVDEVITLNLFYREDDHLRRLMLDDAQAAELNRLWAELRFVSRDALKLVDVFEQLWQYATQDSTPSAFEPMRLPIKKHAEEFRQQLVDCEPVQLESVLKFANTAWRRPLTDSERHGLIGLYHSLRGKEIPHEEALRLTLARVFMAPGFLYKVENPTTGAEQAPVSDFELASRLSYFLWSSAPDATLISLAAEGKLRNPEVLLAQTRRMLADARIRRLAVEFGTQWLHVRDFDQFDEKSERHFPSFPGLRGAMNEEPVRFFTDFFQSNRSVLSLLDADYTFVNAALAGHYGLDGVSGDEWRRVDGVKAKGRGGILGFAATLAKQSGASRTSPILRGNWLSETILGERLPRPPKNVPVLPEEAPTGLTERQLTAKHSSDASCARCHTRIDPFGFALESFDAIGKFRTKDAAGLDIDTHAKLADGTEFDGLNGLREYLLHQRSETFEHQFCRKLLGFALGRSVILSDQPLLGEIVAALPRNDHRIGTAIEQIILSRQFREIRGVTAISQR